MIRNNTKLISVIFIFTITACISEKDKKIVNLDKDSSEEIWKEYDSTIYVGNILGIDARTFLNKYGTTPDSVYGLKPLTESNNAIEIRFYLHNYWSDTSYCTILSYDSIFKLSRIKHYYSYDTSLNQHKTRRSSHENLTIRANADSIFTKLVENGIFSLTELDKKDYEKQKPKELTKNGLINGSYIGDVMDGVAFTLYFKVDTIYNAIHINNPTTYFRHNPDYQLFRRYNEITSLLLLGFE